MPVTSCPACCFFKHRFNTSAAALHVHLVMLNTFAACRYREKQLERFAQQGNQRGVLIVAGGRDMFANAAITVMMLRRHLRSSLPVEIVHFGDAELSKDLLPILQELNSSSTNSSEAAAKGWASGPVYVTDALQAAPLSQLAAHHKPLKEVKSFPAKVYALAYATRFQQVRPGTCMQGLRW
jgi:hypothetical protein